MITVTAMPAVAGMVGVAGMARMPAVVRMAGMTRRLGMSASVRVSRARVMHPGVTRRGVRGVLRSVIVRRGAVRVVAAVLSSFVHDELNHIPPWGIPKVRLATQ